MEALKKKNGFFLVNAGKGRVYEVDRDKVIFSSSTLTYKREWEWLTDEWGLIPMDIETPPQIQEILDLSNKIGLDIYTVEERADMLSFLEYTWNRDLCEESDDQRETDYYENVDHCVKGFYSNGKYAEYYSNNIENFNGDGENFLDTLKEITENFGYPEILIAREHGYNVAYMLPPESDYSSFIKHIEAV